MGSRKSKAVPQTIVLGERLAGKGHRPRSRLQEPPPTDDGLVEYIQKAATGTLPASAYGQIKDETGCRYASSMRVQ